MVLRIVLYVIAALLLGAHFLRAGDGVLVALCLAAPWLFLLRRRWSLNLLQVLAYAAAADWLWIAWKLVALRQSVGQPWLLAAAILLAVAAVTAAAGILLRNRSLQEA